VVGTGLMYYKARYYYPALGRFVSADTIVPEPGNPQSLNRYAYVKNNPLRYVDPSGHLPDDLIREYVASDIDNIPPEVLNMLRALHLGDYVYTVGNGELGRAWLGEHHNLVFLDSEGNEVLINAVIDDYEQSTITGFLVNAPEPGIAGTLPSFGRVYATEGLELAQEDFVQCEEYGGPVPRESQFLGYEVPLWTLETIIGFYAGGPVGVGISALLALATSSIFPAGAGKASGDRVMETVYSYQDSRWVQRTVIRDDEIILNTVLLYGTYVYQSASGGY
jgi:RHS repeat-associated protein